MISHPRALVLFGGLGGATRGLQHAGFDTVSVEWAHDEVAIARAAGHKVVRADVRHPVVPTLVDGPGWLVHSSFPCQFASTAGKRLGPRDERNGWPWTVQVLDALIADGKRPRAFLGENVTGLTFHKKAEGCDGGRNPKPDSCVACYFHGVILPDLRARFAWVDWRITDAADYGVIAPCPVHACESADFASLRSQNETVAACAEGSAMTPCVAQHRRAAWTAVESWARAIRAACAGHAACDDRLESLLALAQSEKLTPRGKAVSWWTTVVTSVSAWPASTVESIASWLSAKWDDLYFQGKLFTMSTETSETTIRLIWRCIETTVTTGALTALEAIKGGCGLCQSRGVPQRRKRVFLLAADEPVAWPSPTHSGAALIASQADGSYWRRHGLEPRGVAAKIRPSEQGDPGLLPWITVRDALAPLWRGQAWYLRAENVGAVARPPDEPAMTQTAKALTYAYTEDVGARREGDFARSGEPHRLDTPAPTVTTTEAKGTRGENMGRVLPNGTRTGGPDRASDALWLATGRRRLTPVECAILCDLPADYPLDAARTVSARYRAVGNVACPAHVRPLGVALLALFR